MRFAGLTNAELRLLDVLLERGVFPDLPASIVQLSVAQPADADTTQRAYPHLRERIPPIMAISRPVGDLLAHGSVSELLSLLARPLRREPTTD